jgi:hypothetical protein
MRSKLLKIGAGISAIVAGVLPFTTHAAADASLVNATTDLSTAFKDNLLGTLFSTATLAVLAVIVMAFVIVMFVSKFLRRHAK